MVAQDTVLTGTDYTLLIPDLLKAHAETTPEKVAYIYLNDGEDDEEVITYKELYDNALNIANQLQVSGAQGERVLMLFPPGLDFIKALFGCFLSKAIAVPAYPPRKNRSLDRIRTLVNDSGAKYVLSTDEIYKITRGSFSDLVELNSLKWIIPAETVNGQPKLPEVRINPVDIALLQYTSGSTGSPKGVMVTHYNIVRNLEFIRQSFSLSSNSVSVSWLPSFHDMGLIDGVIGAVYNGYKAVLMPSVAFIQKPSRWLKAISKYKGTHGGAPNFAYDLCVDNINQEELEDVDLSSMKTLYCGAEPIRVQTYERFIEKFEPYGITMKSMYPCYGMAETTLIISGPEAQRGPKYLCLSSASLERNKVLTTQANDPDKIILVGVGHPWIDTKVKIVNPDTFEEVRSDEVGEIWVSGSIVTKGYWNKSDLTASTFHAYLKGEEHADHSVWLRTGDLGFINDDELFITGRLKDLIILFGKNYYPQDIEYVAEKSHPSIHEGACAAFSIDVDGIEKLVIVAEVKRVFVRNLDTEAVCESIRDSISEEFEQQVYAIQLLRTASIPKTSSGKIQRKACKSGFINKSLEVIGESLLKSPGEPTSFITNIEPASIEAWLIIWVNTKLDVPLEEIDMVKPISNYGLNSLKAVQLQQDFLKQFKVNIPPYYFFEKMTLKDLSIKAYKMTKDKIIS